MPGFDLGSLNEVFCCPLPPFLHAKLKSSILDSPKKNPISSDVNCKTHQNWANLKNMVLELVQNKQISETVVLFLVFKICIKLCGVF